MDHRHQRTPTQLPRHAPKRQDRIRQVARALFGTGMGILLLIVLYLGFFPAPADRPTVAAQDPVEQLARCERRRGTRRLEPVTHTVAEGRNIQIVLDQALPGDTVLISPGVYGESLRVESDAVLLRGLAEGGQRPVLQGMGRLENGIVACADAITLEGIEVRGFSGDGVVVQQVDRAAVRDVFAAENGRRGIFVLTSQRVTVESSAASGAGQAGIYIGESQDVQLRGNEAFGNGTGLAVIASANVRLESNHVHDNTAGILVSVLPGLEIKQTREVRIRDNRVTNNNLDPPEIQQGTWMRLMPGIGILIAADGSEVTANEVRGNRTAGVAVLGLQRLLPDQEGFDVGRAPERNWIHDNSYQDNGYAPDQVADFPGADLLWDLSGWDNLWSEPSASRFPPLLPGPGMPDFVRRGLWRILQIQGQLGVGA